MAAFPILRSLGYRNRENHPLALRTVYAKCSQVVSFHVVRCLEKLLAQANLNFVTLASIFYKQTCMSKHTLANLEPGFENLAPNATGIPRWYPTHRACLHENLRRLKFT